MPPENNTHEIAASHLVGETCSLAANQYSLGQAHAAPSYLQLPDSILWSSDIQKHLATRPEICDADAAERDFWKRLFATSMKWSQLFKAVETKIDGL